MTLEEFGFSEWFHKQLPACSNDWNVSAQGHAEFSNHWKTSGKTFQTLETSFRFQRPEAFLLHLNPRIRGMARLPLEVSEFKD